MRVIKPIDIVGNNELLASSLPVNDHPAYSSAVTYALGDKVTFLNTNYEASNVTTGDLPYSDSPVWLKLGATVRTAPFDNVIGTKAVSTSAISYQMRPLSLVNTIALLNVQALSVAITMTDAVAGQVYQRTIEMSDSAVGDWYEYFFAEYENKEIAIFDDLPAYAGSEIDIVLVPVSTVEVGTIVVGDYIDIGTARWGMSLGITDFSKKSENRWGNVELLKGNYSAKVNVTLDVPSTSVDRVHKTLTKLRSTECLYLVAAEYESSYIYGFYKDFNVIVGGAIRSTCSLELRGLI